MKPDPQFIKGMAQLVSMEIDEELKQEVKELRATLAPYAEAGEWKQKVARREAFLLSNVQVKVN